MQEMNLFRDVGIAILGAVVVGIPALYARIPVLLAYLFAGIILGPHLGFGFIQSADSIALISEFGLILLMFILGLEIDLSKLKKSGKAVLVGGTVQFFGCAAIAWLVYGLFHRSSDYPFAGAYFAMACALSSTLVVVKILSDRMELDSYTSRFTIGILVLQDVFAIFFLAVQPNLSQVSLLAIAKSLGNVLLLLSTAWALAKYIMPSVFKAVARHSELLLLVAVAWCFVVCGLANYLHLSMEMGALIAGVLIAALPYHVDIAARISSLRDFFITLFFVALGLQIKQPTTHVWELVGMMLLVVGASRFVTLAPTLWVLGYGNRAGFITSLNLIQVSEFSLVIGSIGVAMGHAGQELLDAFIISLVLTALLSSFLIPQGHRLFTSVSPILARLGLRENVGKDVPTKSADTEPGSARIVFLGFYREASSTIAELLKRWPADRLAEILIVDFNPEVHRKLKKRGFQCLYGDIGNEDTLAHLPLARAEVVISTVSDKYLKGTTNLKLTRKLRRLAPNARLVMTAESTPVGKALFEAGADHVLMPRLHVAKEIIEILDRSIAGSQEEAPRYGTHVLSAEHELID